MVLLSKSYTISYILCLFFLRLFFLRRLHAFASSVASLFRVTCRNQYPDSQLSCKFIKVAEDIVMLDRVEYVNNEKDEGNGQTFVVPIGPLEFPVKVLKIKIPEDHVYGAALDEIIINRLTETGEVTRFSATERSVSQSACDGVKVGRSWLADAAVFSCWESNKNDESKCYHFYKGCSTCSADNFNAATYSPWDEAKAKEFCLSLSSNSGITIANVANVFATGPCPLASHFATHGTDAETLIKGKDSSTDGCGRSKMFVR